MQVALHCFLIVLKDESVLGGLSGFGRLAFVYLSSLISHYSPCSATLAPWAPFCSQKHMPLHIWIHCTYGFLPWSPVTDFHLQIIGYLLLYIRSQCHLGLTLWHHVPFCHSPHLNLQLHICYQRDRSWHQSESDLSAVGPYHLPRPSKRALSNRRPQTGPQLAQCWGQREGPLGRWHFDRVQ